MREPAYCMRSPHTVCGGRMLYAVRASWFVSHMCRVRIQYAVPAYSMRSRIQYAVIFEVYWWSAGATSAGVTSTGATSARATSAGVTSAAVTSARATTPVNLKNYRILYAGPHTGCGPRILYADPAHVGHKPGCANRIQYAGSRIQYAALRNPGCEDHLAGLVYAEFHIQYADSA